MSDTIANQQSYPPTQQSKVGCGFPLAKLVVWFCVTTGAVLKLQWQHHQCEETGTATLCHAQPGDVVVADSAYGTYVDLALVHSANADAVFRKHHARHCDFRQLGISDHIVQWQRPGRCPQSMPPEDFGALPASIEVREVHLLIQRPGFRPTEIILVTTLVTDPKRYPKAKLAHSINCAGKQRK